MVATLTVPTLTVPMLMVPTLTVPTLMVSILTVPTNGAQRCPMVPTSANPQMEHLLAPNVLLKKRRLKTFRIIRPESRGPQGALGGLIYCMYLIIKVAGILPKYSHFCSLLFGGIYIVFQTLWKRKIYHHITILHWVYLYHLYMFKRLWCDDIFLLCCKLE